MEHPGVERKLAAILAVDVVAYSRLMQADDQATLAALTERRVLFSEKVAGHGGRIVNAPGDSILAEFASALKAVECAVDLQRALAETNATLAEDRRMQFRIGVNLGDVLVDAAGVYGDGVNVAARLESLANPGGICVSRSVQEQVKNRLQFGIEDLGEQRVKNIAEPIRVFRILLEMAAREAATNPPEVPDKPSVAVMRFSVQSEDAKLQLIADALVEDVITLIARVPGFFVVSPRSSFSYRNPATDARTIGQELGVRYLVEGSLRSEQDNVRVATQLTEAGTGKQLWAGRFTTGLPKTLDLQEEIARSVVVELEPELTRAELTVIRRQRQEDTDVWSSYHSAIGAIALGGWNDNSIAEARNHLMRATGRDPGFGMAHAQYALLSALGHVFGLIPDDAATIGSVRNAAERALTLDGASSETVGLAACALADIGDVRRATEFLERAVELDPSNAQALVALGAVRAHARGKDPAEGIALMQEGIRRSPRDRRSAFWRAVLSTALGRLGRFEESLEQARTASRIDPNLFTAKISTALALQGLNLHDEARAAFAEARRLKPNLTPAHVERAYGRRAAQALQLFWGN